MGITFPRYGMLQVRENWSREWIEDFIFKGPYNPDKDGISKAVQIHVTHIVPIPTIISNSIHIPDGNFLIC